MKSFDDKVVVITGAGSGIGWPSRGDFARHGALLAISDVDDAGLAETVDLVEAVGVREVRRTTRRRGPGGVRGVRRRSPTTSAGSTSSSTTRAWPWPATSRTRVRRHGPTIGINFWGVPSTAPAEFLPHLIASGDGYVVNISSLFGLIPMPGQSFYNAAKYAARGISEALREEMLVAITWSASPSSTPVVSRPRSPATRGLSPKGGQAAHGAAVRRELMGQDDPSGRPRSSSRAQSSKAGPVGLTRTRCTSSPSRPACATRTSSCEGR